MSDDAPADYDVMDLCRQACLDFVSLTDIFQSVHDVWSGENTTGCLALHTGDLGPDGREVAVAVDVLKLVEPLGDQAAAYLERSRRLWHNYLLGDRYKPCLDNLIARALKLRELLDPPVAPPTSPSPPPPTETPKSSLPVIEE